MRLIDMDALELPILDPADFSEPEWAKGWNMVVKILKYANTVDPVKHGHLIVDSADKDGGQVCHCSECKISIEKDDGVIIPYCWECGAKLDGEVESCAEA